MSKQRVIPREEIVMIAVPCPRCHSFATIPIDKKREWWSCSHLECQTIFTLVKHYTLIFLKSGEVIRIDRKSKHRYQVR